LLRAARRAILADSPSSNIQEQGARLSDFTPQRLFGRAAEGSWHEEFLERARLERERGDLGASRGALAGYLLARLIERSLDGLATEEERQAYAWQLDSARRYVSELGDSGPEARHLEGLLEALRATEGSCTSAVRLALNAFAYFLENEGRLAEALDVLGLAARTHGASIPADDFASVALFAGRLNRLQARFDAATAAYAAAEEGALAVADANARLISRLGRAHVMRAQGNLPLARSTVEAVIAEAGALDLGDVLSRAYADLGHVLSVQGDRLEALKATYEAFRLAQDSLTRMRILGDLGVELSELGFYDMARTAFEIVVASNTSFIVKTNALLELMDLESTAGNRVAFERHRAELREAAPRMPPSMMVDFRYKTGVGLGRFGQTARAGEAWADGMRLAEAHHLNEWYFRLERMCANLDSCADAQPPRPEPAAPPPAIAELAAGLRAYAEATPV
jgi:tetratricopeptide (TPR) repeat protein